MGCVLAIVSLLRDEVKISYFKKRFENVREQKGRMISLNHDQKWEDCSTPF